MIKVVSLLFSILNELTQETLNVEYYWMHRIFEEIVIFMVSAFGFKGFNFCFTLMQIVNKISELMYYLLS